MLLLNYPVNLQNLKKSKIFKVFYFTRISVTLEKQNKKCKNHDKNKILLYFIPYQEKL